MVRYEFNNTLKYKYFITMSRKSWINHYMMNSNVSIKWAKSYKIQRKDMDKLCGSSWALSNDSDAGGSTKGRSGIARVISHS